MGEESESPQSLARLGRFSVPRSTALVVGLAALAFGLRAAGLDAQGLWRDEVDAIRFATYALPSLLTTFLTPGQNGPLYFLLLRPWLALAGNSEFALRFFSLFFGVLAVPLSYRLAAGLLPGRGRAALAAALLAATSPYLIWYSQEGKMYALVVVLGLLSMHCYLRALRGSGAIWWLGYVLAASASFYVHLIAALLVPAQVLIFLLGPWDRRARLRAWLLSLAVLTLPYLPLLAWQIPALLQSVNTGYQVYGPADMALSLVIDFSLGVAPATRAWVTALFAVLALGVPWLLLWPARPRSTGVPFLSAWLLVPVGAFMLLTLRRPMFTTRYLIFILPAYLLLLAAGLWVVARRSRQVAGALLGVLVLLNLWNVWHQAHTPVKADYRAATYYVVDNMAPRDLVLFQIPYGRYSFDYYLERWTAGHPGQPAPQPSTAASGAYRWAEGLYTNTGLPAAEADRLMAEMTAGSAVVWLIESEAAMWDERGLVRGWLDRHAALTDRTEWTRVTVYRYALPALPGSASQP